MLRRPLWASSVYHAPLLREGGKRDEPMANKVPCFCTRQGAKDMPNARDTRYLLASTGDTWPGYRGDWGRASLRVRKPYHFEMPFIDLSQCLGWSGSVPVAAR